MHRRFRSKARLGGVAAVSASAQTRPAPPSPYAYTGRFKNAAESQAADAALLAKAHSENRGYGLDLDVQGAGPCPALLALNDAARRAVDERADRHFRRRSARCARLMRSHR